MIYKATIELYVEADSWPEACDAVAEGLRDNLRAFAGNYSSWIDWRYSGESLPEEATAAEIEALEYQP